MYINRFSILKLIMNRSILGSNRLSLLLLLNYISFRKLLLFSFNFFKILFSIHTNIIIHLLILNLLLLIKSSKHRWCGSVSSFAIRKIITLSCHCWYLCIYSRCSIIIRRLNILRNCSISVKSMIINGIIFLFLLILLNYSMVLFLLL